MNLDLLGTFDSVATLQVTAAVAPWVVQLIIAVVVAVVSYVLAPTPDAPNPATLDELKIATAAEGRPIPVIFGKPWLKTHNVVWYGDLLAVPIKSSGGKK